MDTSGETAGLGQPVGEKMAQEILDKQSIEVDGVNGASVTSKAAKAALEDCIAQAKGESVEVPVVDPAAAGARVKGYSGPGDWLGEAPSLTPDETMDVETVIVGMGHAGAQAVLGAMQAGGKDVVVLEKRDSDLFDWYGEDIGAYNTCPHGCAYCYANTTPVSARQNYLMHQQLPDNDSIIV